MKKETKEFFCVYLSKFGVNLMVYWRKKKKKRVTLNLARQLDQTLTQKNQKDRLQNIGCMFFIFSPTKTCSQKRIVRCFKGPT